MLNRIDPMTHEEHSRFITFCGSREDALERLPSLCPLERLEFGINRITLVSHRKRVDLLIHAELEATRTHSARSMMLVELRFDSSTACQADEFVQCLQQRHDSKLH